MIQAKLMSPHSETDTLLSWPQTQPAVRASSSLSGSRPRRREEFGRRNELGRRERDRDQDRDRDRNRDRDEFVVPRRAGSTFGTGSRRAPPYDLTFRPNSAFLYHPPPLRYFFERLFKIFQSFYFIFGMPNLAASIYFLLNNKLL